MPLLRATCALLIWSLSFSCSVAEDYTVIQDGRRIDLAARGAIRTEAIWQFQAGAADKILFVCWENPTPAYAKQMMIVRAAVTASWERNSRLRFLDWGPCSPSSGGIRILIEDSGPLVSQLGRGLDGLQNGMVLNFTFRNWMPACQKGQVEDWIADTAVHEFGHAIGFTHEHNRDDTPAWCTTIAAPQGTNPNEYLTPWDRQSEMNYCCCDGDAVLSALDIAAVKHLY
ncbi:ATPase [Rhizobium leguminosarum]|nr:M12 family metallopeptidase [Rhizobium leguminosarum]MBY5555818.1 ATPase [Rhizobium leguminosarum]